MTSLDPLTENDQEPNAATAQDAGMEHTGDPAAPASVQDTAADAVPDLRNDSGKSPGSMGNHDSESRAPDAGSGLAQAASSDAGPDSMESPVASTESSSPETLDQGERPLYVSPEAPEPHDIGVREAPGVSPPHDGESPRNDDSVNDEPASSVLESVSLESKPAESEFTQTDLTETGPPEIPSAGSQERDTGQPDGELMQHLFEDLLRAMGIQGGIRVREDTADQVTLDIQNCADASLIIGRHGQTVDDLQYLGSLILNSNKRDRKRFMLNVENYRERREETLRQNAISLAHQVLEFGQEAVLDPLPPHERRIIHLALMSVPEVYTYSEGEEPDRRLVISPRQQPSSTTPASQAAGISSLQEAPEAAAQADAGETGNLQSAPSEPAHEPDLFAPASPDANHDESAGSEAESGAVNQGGPGSAATEVTGDGAAAGVDQETREAHGDQPTSQADESRELGAATGESSAMADRDGEQTASSAVGEDGLPASQETWAEPVLGAASVENPAFAEDEIGAEQQDLYRVSTELGADADTGGGSQESSSSSASQAEHQPGEDAPDLPETTPGGGSHEGHTGE